jgi:HlyD family secretion protein
VNPLPSIAPDIGSAAASSAAPPRAIFDYDFQTVLAAPPRQRVVLWLMAGLIAVGALELGVAKVDIVVSANGKLVTTDSEIVVQPLETSVVRSLPVKMGQKVEAGEVLAMLDPTFAAADRDELAAKLRNLQATYDRLDVELAGRDYAPTDPGPEERTQLDIWRKRREEYAARLYSAERKSAEYGADLASHKIEAEGLAQQVQLVGDAEGIYKTLVASNLASKLKLLDTSQRVVEAKSRLGTNHGEQQRLEQQVAENDASRDAFVWEWRRKLAEEMAKTRSDRDGVAAQLSKAKRRHEMSVLTAPQAATVLEVASRPAGSVVREAEPLLRLVPAGAPLVAELQVDTRDVARLHVGDAVTVKFEALPWQQFGLAHGVLKTLAPDTQEDASRRETAEDMASPDLKTGARQSPIHYRAQVELDEPRFRNLPPDFALRPGMRLVADIDIGRRTVLEYILNPITRVIDESLREP